MSFVDWIRSPFSIKKERNKDAMNIYLWNLMSSQEEFKEDLFWLPNAEIKIVPWT